ncbi:MAG: Re/Si-specific NAD(P)(+) transhydrogenase subunit alpha [Rickettsiales bacterium]|nr:Re/Si-specific NAD(P)(+) transhydrogenase subunit alpha [Rickettsiales bacterium]
MKIAICKETASHESRAAISPDAIKKYVGLGAEIHVQSGATEASAISDDKLKDAGATIHASVEDTCKNADLLLSVQAPTEAMLNALPKDAAIIGMLDPFNDKNDIELYKTSKRTSFTLELLPRISRAQSMDVLSSQSNLAGYRSVIEAAQSFGKVIPMMMTAAGTVPPAKVLVLGAGVAGLQAIATAKRLGAVVSAFDVRPAVKEQVESLGAKFIEVEAEEEEGETSGGYAKEMSEDYQRKQSELIHETLKSQDICITTALIPGKPAPELITTDMLKDMKDGSVIVDLAVIAGGNCKSSKLDKVSTAHGVTLIGYSNMPSRAAVDATPLYARNLFNFVSTLMIDKENKKLDIQWDDELIQGTLLTKDGDITHPMVRSVKGLDPIEEPKEEPKAEETASDSEEDKKEEASA